MADKPGAVLVTGANSGIGLATTLALARRGWETWGTVRSQAKAKALSAAAEQVDVGDLVRPVVLDVSDDKAVVARWKDLPGFYAVVNNAGYSELGAVEEVSAKEARAQLDVNVIAPAVVSSCALPAMRERGSGRIVMVSSVAGRAAIMPLNAWYHASKFALEALSDVLRIEVAGFGIKVSIVEPGFFKTGIEASAQRSLGCASRRGLAVPHGVSTVHERAQADRTDGAAPGRCRPCDRLGHRERPAAEALSGRRGRVRGRHDPSVGPEITDRRGHPPDHRTRRRAEHLRLTGRCVGKHPTIRSEPATRRRWPRRRRDGVPARGG